MNKNQGVGSVRDLPKKEKPQESLRDVLLRFGLNPDRVVAFIDLNLQNNKDAADSKRGAIDNLEYAREQLIFNDVQILRLLLDE